MKYTNLLPIIMSVILCSQTFSQTGSLDESFGERGKVLTTSAGDFLLCRTSALQRDGKLLAAGRFSSNEKPEGFCIIRYLTDGTVDSSFGKAGLVITDFDDSLSYDYGSEIIYSLAIQPDGKIVAAGQGYRYSLKGQESNNIPNWNFQLARYLPDGRLDSSFGKNGKVETDFGQIEQGYAMLLLPDGRIVVAGSTAPLPFQPFELIEDFLLVRYLPDGRVDESFGDKGKVITNFSSSYEDIVKSLALQEDGRIVAGGSSRNVGDYNTGKFALARYNTNGTLDIGFGEQGKVVTDFGANSEEIRDIAVQQDGKIVAVGFGNDFLLIRSNMALVRYNVDGRIDPSFGTEGKANIRFSEGSSRAESISLQANGKIILAGDVYSSTIENFALARCNKDGNLDSTFGTNGKVVTDMGGYDYAYSSVLQADGKIVLAGESDDEGGTYSSFAIARYNGDPIENPLISKIDTWIRNNMLGWYTTNSNNVNYYCIQRSSTGTSFQEEKRIPAQSIPALVQQAQSNERQTYGYALSAAAPNSYYRVAAIKKDGSVAYSDAVYYRGSSSLINVYPNPAKNMLGVSGLKGSSTLTITNEQGFPVKRIENIKASSYQINIAQLPRGTYYLKASDETGNTTVQFLKQ